MRQGAAQAQEIAELRRKYELEVAAHRGNVVLLHQAWADLDEMSRHFMDLHDSAKRFAGPRLKKPNYSEPHPNGGTWPTRAQLAADGE